MNENIDENKTTSAKTFKEGMIKKQKITKVCIRTVTPAPKVAIGTVSYYLREEGEIGWLSRSGDFYRRHKMCGHDIPEYYKDYGNKYIRRFTNDLHPKLSKTGRKWLIEARKLLQTYMEDGFKNNKSKDVITIKCYRNPGYTSEVTVGDKEYLEIKDSIFKEFAYATHAPAYIDAGIIELSLADMALLGFTPDFKDSLFSSDGLGQMRDIAEYYLGTHNLSTITYGLTRDLMGE